jgi:hypothetical protein
VPDGPGDLQIIETGDALKVKQVLDECLQKAVSQTANDFLWLDYLY